MSFRCSKCTVVHPNPAHPTEFRPTKVVVAARPRWYRFGLDRIPGWEIAKEASLCTTCVEAHTPITVDLADVPDDDTYESNLHNYTA